MKIALLLARGLEGCGVTKSAVEFKELFPGVVDIFATNDKKWPRRDSMKWEATEFKCGDDEEAKKIAFKIHSEYDILIIYSVPSKSHSDECKKNFLKMIKAIKKPHKAIVQHDHSIHSIIRNANLKETIQMCDHVFMHSLKGDFNKWMDKNEIFHVERHEFGPGFHYDNHRKKFWKPIEQQNKNIVRWLGRTAFWKGPTLMIDFHEWHLRDAGYITILEGLEASIQWPGIVYRNHKDKTDRRDVVNFFRQEKEHPTTQTFGYGTERYNIGAYLYPPFEHDDAMERLSLSAFGAELYNLRNKAYGKSFEYIGSEIVASGVIPIIHRDYGRHVNHRTIGKPLIDCENSGTLFLDNDNMKEIAKQMHKLRVNSGMRDEWREMAFEFWKAHANSYDLFKDMIAIIIGREPIAFEELLEPTVTTTAEKPKITKEVVDDIQEKDISDEELVNIAKKESKFEETNQINDLF